MIEVKVQEPTCEVGLIIKSHAFKPSELEKHYNRECKPTFISVDYDKKKPSTGFMKEQYSMLVSILDKLKITTLLIADSHYFKHITGESSLKSSFAVVPSLDGKYQCIPIPNYQQLFYDDRIGEVMQNSLTTLGSLLQNKYVAPGTNLLANTTYPSGKAQIEESLHGLLQAPMMAVDIEAFSLDFSKAGIGSIAMASSTERAVAFLCDYKPCVHTDGLYGLQEENHTIKELLYEFFSQYQGNYIFQNGYNFDVKVLVHDLFMNHIHDYSSMLEGIKTFYKGRRFYDTQVMAYLATNTTAGNTLNLKDNSVEFAGNYAEDVVDIRKLEPEALLRYNATDALSTYYVYGKYFTTMTEDNQWSIYDTIFEPSMPVITQTEMIGMPMNMATIKATKAAMVAVRDKATHDLQTLPIMSDFLKELREFETEKDYQARRDKAKNPDKIKRLPHKFEDMVFNPASSKQLASLLFGHLHLPVIDRTPTGNPSTGVDVLIALRNTLKSEIK